MRRRRIRRVKDDEEEEEEEYEDDDDTPILMEPFGYSIPAWAVTSAGRPLQFHHPPACHA